jgi:hypothetical protein
VKPVMLRLGLLKPSLKPDDVGSNTLMFSAPRLLAEGRHTPPIKFFVMQNHQLIHRRLSCGNPPIPRVRTSVCIAALQFCKA